MTKKYFYIGEVAKRLGIHNQTIRMYERRHLIKPMRTVKHTRVFTRNDIKKINVIIVLTQELGLNLSGVKIVFSLARRLKMSNDELLDFIQEHKKQFSI